MHFDAIRRDGRRDKWREQSRILGSDVTAAIAMGTATLDKAE